MPIATPSLPNILLINSPSSEVSLTPLDFLATIHTLDHDTNPTFIDSLRTLFAAHPEPFVGVIYFSTIWQKGKPPPFLFTEPVLRCLVEEGGVRCITGLGAGFDGVDISLLSSLGCVWANNPSCVGIRTADSTCLMIQQVLRGTSQAEARIRAGGWRDTSLVIKDIRSCTLGIVGMGSIGSMVARTMRFLGMKVIYSKRTRLSPQEEGDYTHVSLEELLARSDVISLNCPLTSETHHILNAEAFAKMKEGVCIVNTSRGGCIDEAALVNALGSGKVLRAALDVFETEPIPSPKLVSMDSVILSPHSAALNETMCLGNETEIVDNMISFLTTGSPMTPVNRV